MSNLPVRANLQMSARDLTVGTVLLFASGFALFHGFLLTLLGIAVWVVGSGFAFRGIKLTDWKKIRPSPLLFGSMVGLSIVAILAALAPFFSIF